MRNYEAGCFLIDKPAGITSFGVIEALQIAIREKWGCKRKDLPKLGHCGTLDPFATGLLVVCIGEGVKLSRYFLESQKRYSGVIRFGETTASGDTTDPVIEKTDVLPHSREQLTDIALGFLDRPYMQIPPMHSAKKKNGVPLYELARQGIEIERKPVPVQIQSFEITDFHDGKAGFSVTCSHGTYIRTLAQDLAKLAGSLGLLEVLRRTGSGHFDLISATPLEILLGAIREDTGSDPLPSFVPFHRMLESASAKQVPPWTANALRRGRHDVLQPMLSSEPEQTPFVPLYCRGELIAIARRPQDVPGSPWRLERVFAAM